MKFLKHYKCTACQAIYTKDTAINLCPVDGRPLELVIDVDRITQGLIHSGDKVVAFNTGSFEKYLPNVRHLIFDQT